MPSSALSNYLRVCSTFIALIIACALSPSWSAQAATASPSVFSTSRIVSSIDNEFRLTPRLTASFMPDGEDGPSADLVVNKTASSNNIQPGSNITYTIVVGNLGPDTSTDVTLADALPAGTTFVSLSAPAGWICTTPNPGDNGSISCSIQSLPVTDGELFSLVVNVPAETAQDTFLTNVATVSAALLDPNDENNSSSAGTLVAGQSADVSVSKTSGSDTARADSNVTYTIVVSNSGPNTATSINMQDTLPGDMTLVSFTQATGPTFTCTTPAAGAGGTINCSVDSLSSGASATFQLVGHIPAGTPANTSYENTAIVTSATHDPNDENNSSTISTTVVTCDFDAAVFSNADSGAGSLRQIVLDACPGSIITFAPLLTGPITLTSGPIVINKPLKIQGPGAGVLTIRRSSAEGVPEMSIFNVQSNVEISGLTISGGKTSGQGGGIVNTGSLTLTDVVVNGNTAASGGGIYNAGTGLLTIKNSTISGNTATSNAGAGGAGLYTTQGTVTIISTTFKDNVAADLGGAIYSSNTTLNLLNDTFNNNTAQSGAGVYNDGVTLAKLTTIINSTISSNTGNGITNNSGTVRVINSTITNNTANAASASGGGAVNIGGAVFNVGNTIIAGNNAATTSRDVQGSFNSLSNNLIGIADGSTGFTNGVNGDLVGTFAAPLDARLGPLANNGGPTQTHALLFGSPAIEAGNNALLPADTFDLDDDGNTAEPLPVDQRGPGFIRAADSADNDTGRTVDIGAYEAQVTIEDVTDKTVAEDGTLTFLFNVGDGDLISSVTASSSDTSLVPNAPEHLSISGSGATRALQITPLPNRSGATTITLTVTSNNGEVMSDSFVLTVTPVNDAPQAVNDSYSTAENTPLNVAAPGVLANDVDIDNATLSALVVSNPANGTLLLNANGSFVYTPNAGFTGADSFTYKANDGAADSNVATVNIAVQEGGTLQLSSTSYSVAEDAGSAVITITRTNGTAGTATVLLSTSNGTAGASDYTSVSQTVTFNDGETTKTVNIPVTDDANDEADETVNITLSNAGGSGQLGSPTTAVLTIQDNDAAPSISINTLSVTEGNSGTTTAIFTVTLSAASSKTVTVDYATADGTATAGNDYQSTSGTLTFAPGETSKQVAVNIIGDLLDEADETFFVNLTNATNSTISGAQGTGTITDDDATPALSINDVSLTEGNSGTKNFNFTVTLAQASSLTVSVDFVTANGTATAGSDYQSATGTLTFIPGDLTKTVTVQVNGDTVNEPNETFFVNLSNAQNASIADNQGVGTIQNDDAPGVQFSTNSFTFNEGAGHGDITVTRTGDTSQAMTVDYITSDQSGLTPCQTNNTGFASDRCDYATAAGTLSFAAGEAQKTISLILIDDAYVEGPEQLSIRLLNPAGATLDSVDTATVTITDNDSQVATQNPIDNLDFFIRQLYIDFLGREPDVAGFNFWKARMTGNCPAGQTCDRIDTALRFFTSDEFRARGYFVYVFYHAALGRRPTYSEWILDVAKLNGFQTPAEQQASRDAFINEFMNRQEFMNFYNQFQTGETFVNALIQKSGVTPASKQSLIDNYATVGRAATLKAFMETPEVQAAFVDRAFVTMLYFGFLRRDAEAGGFDFWMQKLNETNHDYRFITGGFINSDEYRFRFHKP